MDQSGLLVWFVRDGRWFGLLVSATALADLLCEARGLRLAPVSAADGRVGLAVAVWFGIKLRHGLCACTHVSFRQSDPAGVWLAVGSWNNEAAAGSRCTVCDCPPAACVIVVWVWFVWIDERLVRRQVYAVANEQQLCPLCVFAGRGCSQFAMYCLMNQETAGLSAWCKTLVICEPFIMIQCMTFVVCECELFLRAGARSCLYPLHLFLSNKRTNLWCNTHWSATTLTNTAFC